MLQMPSPFRGLLLTLMHQPARFPQVRQVWHLFAVTKILQVNLTHSGIQETAVCRKHPGMSYLAGKEAPENSFEATSVGAFSLVRTLYPASTSSPGLPAIRADDRGAWSQKLRYRRFQDVTQFVDRDQSRSLLLPVEQTRTKILYLDTTNHQYSQCATRKYRVIQRLYVSGPWYRRSFETFGIFPAVSSPAHRPDAATRAKPAALTAQPWQIRGAC
eukprot:1287450-Rhodomonas_salina.2